MTKNRHPTKDELDLWRRVTADVERLTVEEQAVRPKPTPTKSKNAVLERNPRRSKASSNKPALPKPTSIPPIDPNGPLNSDRRTFEKLKRGKMAIDGRLDLHGRTQLEAHDALCRFLAASVARRFRCVLVVTGKGYDGHGVLRQMVPRWLTEQDNRQRIVTYCAAQPRHGGDGALYILLKRHRV